MNDRSLRRRGGVNTSAVSILRYSTIFIGWRKTDKINGLEASNILKIKKRKITKVRGQRFRKTKEVRS